MEKQLRLTLILTCILATSCGKTPSEPVLPESEKIPICIAPSPITKVTDNAYEIGDVTGLYVVNSGSSFSTTGNHVDNMAFSFNGSSWQSSSTIYWKDQNTPANFYCYYPRTENISDISAVPFSVKTDQSTLEGYKASELLCGSRLNVSPTADAVKITTTHRMSKILVYIVPGNGYTDESLANENLSLTINNLKVSAKLNLSSGEVTADGNPVDIIPYKEDGYYCALVPPQSLTNQTLISLRIGQDSFSLKETISLKSNTQHKVTLTVNKVSEGINIGIGNWENDNQDYGGTVN